MDYTTALEETRKKLLDLGFTEKQYEELLEEAAEEMINLALLKLEEKDLNILQSLENQLIPEVSTLEEAEKNIDLIFSTAYGEESEEMKKKMLYEYLQKTLEQTASKQI
jgi:hypothetical protein